MSLALLFLFLMLNMFRMLIHPSLGACDLFVESFRGLYCSESIEGKHYQKHTTRKENSITIRHRISQYLQKHDF